MRLVCVVLAALAAALNPACFDPDLGNTPVRCAASGKQCPDGYTCAPHGVCVREDSPFDGGMPELTVDRSAPSKVGPIYLDGAVALDSKGCIDPNEPNNSSVKATLISSPGQFPSFDICPPGDVDHYAVDLQQGDSLAVRLYFQHPLGDLDAVLLDPAGAVVATARTTGDSEQLSLPEAAKPGRYIFAVVGFGPATNAYDLEVSY